MRIEELTVRPPVTASPATTIQQAAALMARDAVGTLVITEGERVVGIVTDRDVVVRAVAKNLPLDSRIDGVMSMNVIALDAGTDVRDALHAFGQHAVRRLPIVSGGKVSGLLSLDDVVVALAGQFGEVTRGMSAQLLFPHAFDEPSPPAPIG
ncbi:MAG: CBS domain-containing protein [Ilumatobacteraceae bacterium]|jgi:signal-transduction protein with cAMP-binding, CBS, and nucleotidyltransferase domain|nr:CBS domain-containing protein [Acidimicrobiaceae bacterium]MBP6488784.1 CBS domain-containing protein [Ilumatobacteraceae bacterium]MBK9971106.1 CBS domain-containing protein [Acidimicrobiaceae bacterium]MBP7890540.1 CBS domain-containing protein [Ilumatobacteraceae bacterium]MBP8211239.1 CBS domain-containing protein [Ilumatobacteraceae bacterium]